MTEHRALHQDIRPLKIGILNLMPTKVATETQILRSLSNTPLQIEVTLVQTSTYTSKNTSHEHLLNFYKTFDEIKDMNFDGFIITGAPVEHLPFEEVDYWEEICKIMDWTKTHVHSTFHICWAAQAALYYHYGIPKYPLPEKLSGVFRHTLLTPKSRLFRGFDSEFWAPAFTPYRGSPRGHREGAAAQGDGGFRRGGRVCRLQRGQPPVLHNRGIPSTTRTPWLWSTSATLKRV